MATASLWPVICGAGSTRDLFFTPTTADEVVDAVAPRLQNESYLAFLAMLVRWPRPKRIVSPTLVIAAEQDAIFPLAEERDLADALGASLLVIEGCGHDAMLDGPWPQVAEAVAGWRPAVPAGSQPA